MIQILFWIFSTLSVIFAFLFVVRQKRGSVFYSFLLFFLSLGGVFLAFRLISVWTLYLFISFGILFLAYIYSNIKGKKIAIKDGNLTGLKFMIYVTAVFYLLFVCFVIVFGGEDHVVDLRSGFTLSMIKNDIAAKKFILPIVIMSIVVFFASFVGIVPGLRRRK